MDKKAKNWLSGEKMKEIAVPLIAGLVIGFLIGMALSGGVLGEGFKGMAKRSIYVSEPTSPKVVSGIKSVIGGGPSIGINSCGSLSCDAYQTVTYTNGSISTHCLNSIESRASCTCTWNNLSTAETGGCFLGTTAPSGGGGDSFGGSSTK